jgi:hypothetical protein
VVCVVLCLVGALALALALALAPHSLAPCSPDHTWPLVGEVMSSRKRGRSTHMATPGCQIDARPRKRPAGGYWPRIYVVTS